MDEAEYQAIIKDMGKDVQDLKRNYFILNKEFMQLRDRVNKEMFPLLNELGLSR